MKSGLENAIPRIKLQKVQKPHELFSLMVEAELLSPNKLDLLGHRLSSAGRQDLRKQLEGELKILLEQLCTQQYSPYVKPANKLRCFFFGVNILNNCHLW